MRLGEPCKCDQRFCFAAMVLRQGNPYPLIYKMVPGVLRLCSCTCHR